MIESDGTLAPLAYLVTANADTQVEPSKFGMISIAFHPDFAQVGEAGYGKFYTIETEVQTGTITLGALTDTPAETVVGPADPARRRFNGGNYTTGVLAPARLGELAITSSGDAEGTIVIRELRVVNAALELTTPVPQPGGVVIVEVPEPGYGLSMLFGVGWLAMLRRRVLSTTR